MKEIASARDPAEANRMLGAILRETLDQRGLPTWPAAYDGAWPQAAATTVEHMEPADRARATVVLAITLLDALPVPPVNAVAVVEPGAEPRAD